MIDPSKPNHYTNDSLGEPFWCTGDHNHPDVNEMAAEAAERAACNRCGVNLLEETSAAALVVGTFDVPVTGFKGLFCLCGKCGIAFREFINPEILADPFFQDVKQKLHAIWG